MGNAFDAGQYKEQIMLRLVDPEDGPDGWNEPPAGDPDETADAALLSAEVEAPVRDDDESPDDELAASDEEIELDPDDEFGPITDADVEELLSGTEALIAADAPDSDGDEAAESPSDYLGHANARSLLLAGGARGLRPAVAALAEQSRVGEAESARHVAEQGYTSRAQQHTAPTTAQLASLGAYGLSKALGSALNAMFGLPGKAAMKSCQSFMEARHFNEFEKHLREAKEVAKDWRKAGGDELGDEQARELLDSFDGQILQSRMAKAVREIELSSRRAAEVAMKNNGEAEIVLRRTAEEVARFADHNKRMLELMSDGKRSLMERLDQITNSLFSVVKAAVMKLFGLDAPKPYQPRMG